MFEGRVLFVTGGGSGIGRGIVERMARDGADVCVVDIDLDAAEESAAIARALACNAISVRAHVGMAESIGAAVTACVESLGRLDFAVTSAAIHRGGPLVDLPLKDWNEVIEVNLTGTFLTAQAVAREMVHAGNGGRIVCISSGGSVVVSPNNWAYSATKTGVDMMVRHWAQELGPAGITVNAIAPGITETPLIKIVIGDEGERIRRHAEQSAAVGRIGQPADIAGMVAFLCGPDGGFVTGTYLLVDGGGRDSAAYRATVDPEADAERMRHLGPWLDRAAHVQSLIDELRRDGPSGAG